MDDARSIQQRIIETSWQIARLLAEEEERLRQSMLPSEFELTAVYPNPFNNSVRIGFSIVNDAEVRLAIYDLSERLVEEIGRGQLKSGHYTKVWNATNVSAGSYLIRLETAEHSITRKVALIK